MTHRDYVIFDVDGVLVDSYSAHFRSWLALADEGRSPRMTEDQFRTTFGRTSRETIAVLWPHESWGPAQIAELDDRKEVLFREILRTEFRPIPGAAALIESLHDAGIRLAAGSSGPPDNVFLVLENLGCRDRFDVVVTGADVQRGKPDPEVFLACARGLNAEPVRCAVIEDAIVGVEAANRAGMYSIALVTNGRDVAAFAHARRVVRSLDELTPQNIRESLRLGGE
jgi:beta-phosphoglucomutase